MLYREISRILGLYLFCLAGALCIPLLAAAYYQWMAHPQNHPQTHSTFAFFITLLICLALALFFRYAIGRRATGSLYRREALFLVVIIWFVTALIGAIPFVLSRTLTDPLDAYFEAMSGLTTTGATVMRAKEYDPLTGEEIPIVRDFPGFPPVRYEFYGTIPPVIDPATGEVVATGIEAVGKALLFWRSLMQWIGGAGIVLLFLAVLPALGVGGKVLYQAEATGPMKESLTPRIRETAGLTWKLYLGLSVLQVILLLATNPKMAFFDSLCITLSSISTGGYSVRNGNIGAYNNLATEIVVMVFMFLGSLNFVLFTHILHRKFRRIFEPEFNIYVIQLVIVSLFVIYQLFNTPGFLLPLHPEIDSALSIGKAIRYGVFQLLSLQTSTGFATADYDLWPFIVQVVLLAVMFIGGMSASTAGGIKVIRHAILCRLTGQQIELMFRPEVVRTLRIGNVQVDSRRATTVLTFFFIVMALTLIGTLALVADGVDPVTALSTNASMLNNVGGGFRMAGPTESFAFLNHFGQIVSILWMVFGRLEYFAILIVFLPEFWKR
jgi:trk system potassium uptake protein